MNNKTEAIILSLTKSEKIIKTELIQTLWSGYGELSRVTLNNKSVILKHIKYPSIINHPHGWTSNISHQRKLKSYQIELDWYKFHSKEISNAYSPKYIGSLKDSKETYLILEDLKNKNFEIKTKIDWKHIKLCLKWLAFFHAKHIDYSAKELWKIGTYWHLETRPDELKNLTDENLKDAAPYIDEKLNSSQFQTLVHGDAKLANFLFNETEVSAVDFQYIGGGVGVKDLAYFLSSIYNENELFENEIKCLDYYFEELKNAFLFFKTKVDTISLEKDWRELYPFAWCDFYRFLKGWSPDHWKLNSYSEHMKQEVLNCF